MKKYILIGAIALVVMFLVYYFIIKPNSKTPVSEAVTDASNHSIIQSKINDVLHPQAGAAAYVGPPNSGTGASTPKDIIDYFRATYSGDGFKSRVLTEAKFLLGLTSDTSTISEYSFV